MSEVGEALNADRRDRHAKSNTFNRWCTQLREPNDDNAYANDFNCFIKDTVEDELADIAIRILDLAGLRGYDCSEYFDTSVMTLRIPEKDGFSWFCYRLFSIFTNSEDTCNTTDEILDSAALDLAFYCKQMDVDLYTHIVWKMKYNELRPKLNGKAY